MTGNPGQLLYELGRPNREEFPAAGRMTANRGIKRGVVSRAAKAWRDAVASRRRFIPQSPENHLPGAGLARVRDREFHFLVQVISPGLDDNHRSVVEISHALALHRCLA